MNANLLYHKYAMKYKLIKFELSNKNIKYNHMQSIYDIHYMKGGNDLSDEIKLAINKICTPGTSSAPISSAKPAPKSSATSSAKPAPKSSATSSAKPAPKSSAKPAPKSSAKSSPTSSAKPAPKSSAKSSPTSSAKPAPKSSAKPAPKSSAKSSPTSSAVTSSSLLVSSLSSLNKLNYEIDDIFDENNIYIIFERPSSGDYYSVVEKPEVKFKKSPNKKLHYVTLNAGNSGGKYGGNGINGAFWKQLGDIFGNVDKINQQFGLGKGNQSDNPNVFCRFDDFSNFINSISDNQNKSSVENLDGVYYISGPNYNSFNNNVDSFVEKIRWCYQEMLSMHEDNIIIKKKHINAIRYTLISSEIFAGNLGTKNTSINGTSQNKIINISLISLYVFFVSLYDTLLKIHDNKNTKINILLHQPQYFEYFDYVNDTFMKIFEPHDSLKHVFYANKTKLNNVDWIFLEKFDEDFRKDLKN
jgi:hypothetical protein